MEELHALEEAAGQLAAALSSPGVRPVNTETKGRTLENLESRRERLDSEVNDKVDYFRERLADMQALFRRPVPEDPRGVIKEFSSLASDMNRTLAAIERDREASEKLNKAYKGRLLSEMGTDDPTDIGTKIVSLTGRMDELKGRFFGKLISRQAISQLDTEVKRLEELGTKYNEAQVRTRPPGIMSNEDFKYGDLRFDIAYELAKALQSRYVSLLQDASRKKGLTKGALDSLADDIVSRCRKRIAEYARENRMSEGYSKEEVKEALSILREGLEHKRGSTAGDPKDVQRKGQELEERLASLPNHLQNIIGEYLSYRKTANEEFREIASYIMRAMPGSDIERIMLSLEKAEGSLSKVSSGISILTKDIKEEFGHSGTEALSGIDIEKWELFSSNSEVRKIYGRETLDRLEKMIRDSVLAEVLTKPGDSYEYLNMELKAAKFRDPRAIAYNIINFWKGWGRHRTEKARLEYITSLTDEDIRSVSILGIPGIVDVIEEVRKNPKTFDTSKIIEGGKYVENPAYWRIKEAIIDACDHMLRKGTSPEQYFISSLATDMNLLHDASEQEYEKIMGALSDSMGLDETVRSNFSKHKEKFMGRLNSTRREGYSPNFLQRLKEDIGNVSKFYDNLGAALEKSRHIGRLMEEIDYVESHAIRSGDPLESGRRGIEYLKALDTDLVQGLLGDRKYGEIFSRRLYKLKDAVMGGRERFFDGDEPEDIKGYIVSDLSSMKDVVNSASKLLSRSKFGSSMEGEMNIVLTSLAAFSWNREDLVGRGKRCIEYLKAFDTDIIQDLVGDKKYGEKFRRRLDRLRDPILSVASIGAGQGVPEDLTGYLTSDLSSMKEVIDSASAQIGRSKFGGLMNQEFEIILEKLINSDGGFKENSGYVKEYLAALNDKDTARDFGQLEWVKRDSVRLMAMRAYSADKGLIVPLVRKVVDKERSISKISLIAKGVDMLGKNRDLMGYLKDSLDLKPDSGYALLTGLCLATPVLDDKFYGSLSEMFQVGKLEDYGVPEDMAAMVSKKGLSEDRDILYYCKLMSAKGKSPKKIPDIIKAKEQIAKIEKDLEGNPENKTLLNMVHDRRKKIHSMINDMGSMIEGYRKESCSRALEAITGEMQEVKDIDENLINAILTHQYISGGNKGLLADMLRNYLNGEPLKAYQDERNQEALERYSKMGIDTDKWLKGIKRTYTTQKVEDVEARKEEEVSFQVSEAVRLYASLGIEVKGDEVFSKYEEVSMKEGVPEEKKLELRAHLDNINSLKSATYNSKVGKVEIYVEQNPLMVLQMGNVVFGSCLGLGKGNTFSTVANAVDANKRVLYARMGNEIVGRKLIALNDSGQIVQFRTYNNKMDLEMSDLFNKYLKEFGKEIGAELGSSGEVSRIVSSGWYNDGIVPFGEAARPSRSPGRSYSRTG